jgi:hypothetical protein
MTNKTLYMREWCKTPKGKEYRRRHLERKRQLAPHLKQYGLTLDDYEQMFLRQHGQCAICDVTVQGERMCVDHDHETGTVRGLLCRLCNKSLGGFRDDVELLHKAVAYLQSVKE